MIERKPYQDIGPRTCEQDRCLIERGVDGKVVCYVNKDTGRVGKEPCPGCPHVTTTLRTE
jgi:hypothetical protein